MCITFGNGSKNIGTKIFTQIFFFLFNHFKQLICDKEDAEIPQNHIVELESRYTTPFNLPCEASQSS